MVCAVSPKILELSAFDPVETAVTHFFKQCRHGHAFSRKAFCKPTGSEFVDEFEWPPFPGVAVLHGLIHRVDVVGDFRNQRRCVAQCMGQDPPGILSSPVGMFDQSPQAASSGLDAFQSGFACAVVFPRDEIQGFFHFAPIAAVEPIKPAFAFSSGVAVGDHLFNELAATVNASVHVVFWQQRKHGAFDMGLKINADQVEQAENSCFRNPHGLADNRISLFNSDAVLESKAHCDTHP